MIILGSSETGFCYLALVLRISAISSADIGHSFLRMHLTRST